jgi:gamma-glutamylcyclotransferase (GGCT)/AIG2-like uncharacterized protein YtfP
MPLVFVYGTLMRGGANHDVLRRLGGSFVTAATTRSPRTLVDLGPYPALLALGSREDAAPVTGEVWEITDAALRELDAFEGVPDLYLRERLTVGSAGRGDAIEAFVYVLAGSPPPHARVIPTGRYGRAGTALPDGAKPEQLVRRPNGDADS